MLERNTKYTEAVKSYVTKYGHATNAAILAELQKVYADLSATTVHRITSRMVERGELALAPVSCENCTRFDATTEPHDHFSCTECDCLRDVTLPQKIREQIQQQLSGCTFSGPLTISGVCTNCKEKETNV